jgi:hypothetical protein
MSDAAPAVEAHLIAHLGPIAARLDVPVPAGPPLQLLVFAPTAPTDDDDDEPTWTVSTLGMSARPMAVPTAHAAQVPARAELLVRIADGPLAPVPSAPLAAQPWPLHLLAAAALLPTQTGVWLGAYHTLPIEQPPLAAFMLVPPTALDADRLGDVAFYGLLGLRADQLAAARRDPARLMATLIDAGLDDTLAVTA